MSFVVFILSSNVNGRLEWRLAVERDSLEAARDYIDNNLRHYSGWTNIKIAELRLEKTSVPPPPIRPDPLDEDIPELLEDR